MLSIKDYFELCCENIINELYFTLKIKYNIMLSISLRVHIYNLHPLTCLYIYASSTYISFALPSSFFCSYNTLNIYQP